MRMNLPPDFFDSSLAISDRSFDSRDSFISPLLSIRELGTRGDGWCGLESKFGASALVVELWIFSVRRNLSLSFVAGKFLESDNLTAASRNSDFSMSLKLLL